MVALCVSADDHARIARPRWWAGLSVSTHARVACMAMAAKSDQLEDAGSPGAPAPPPPDPVYTLRPFAGEVMMVKYANFGKKQAVMAG